MKSILNIVVSTLVLIFGLGCSAKKVNKIEVKKVIKEEMTAAQILGNPDYLAISYGGYREKSRED
ncbi:MAG: glycosyl hydrolase family 17, partial [Polaribacter sp.]|nr:glycosyl hydrolase family 17 [Polaribacter sp.]